MARQKTIVIARNDIKKYSREELEKVNTVYRLVTISNVPIGVDYVKIVEKKPTAFLTIRHNLILFNGDMDELISNIQKKEDKASFYAYAFDFDGVINSYKSGWTGANEIIDAPVNGIIQLLKEIMKKKKVLIYSTRCTKENGVSAMKHYLKKYEVEVEKLEFCETISDEVLLIDDRVVDSEDIVDIVDFANKFDSWVNKCK